MPRTRYRTNIHLGAINDVFHAVGYTYEAPEEDFAFIVLLYPTIARVIEDAQKREEMCDANHQDG